MTKWTEEQKEAIYKDGTNIIVSAGAGSGKTAVLTERVLEKVKNGISLSNLLILTFTKLAAKEMRERIGSKLEENNFTEELSILDTADITTFDAYALSLVKKYHYYLNLSKNINVIESSVITLYKKSILDEIFEELYNKEDQSFLSLIREYCVKNDKDIRDFILLINDKLDLKTNKKEYLDNYLMVNYNEEKIDKDIEEYTNMLLEQIDSMRANLEYIEESEFQYKMFGVLNPLFESRTYDDIKENIEIKLPIARGLSDISKEYKEKISNTLKEIKKYTGYSSEKEIKEGILKTKPFIEEVIEIIKQLDSRVSAYKKEYDYYEYSDIAGFAIKLVKENEEIRNEIKNNLNEILIDEYQDTNDIQEEFISYISNNNVYMVGDIKQSIYRFRNANPYIFKNKYDNYSINKGGIKIDLNKNFRSREEVISNINLMFDKIMDDDIGGASYSTSHQMIFGNLMYTGPGNNGQNNDFEVYSYLNDTNFKKEEIEAFIIAEDINNKINNNYLAFGKEEKGNRKIKYSDFVILMDNSKNFELYKKILEYKGIPTSIIKSSNLLDGNLIPIIKNIISIIIKIKEGKIDTEFKKIFISLGRSFLFNIDDNMLFDYFLNNNFKNSQIYTIGNDIAGILDTIPLEKLIDIIIEKYDIYNKLILIGDIKSNILKLEKLKEITKTLVNLNYSVYDYQKYLEKIIEEDLKIEYKINENDENTVKIMTIHASKGLEFNICYFSGLYNKFNLKEATSKFSYDNKYGMIIEYKENFKYDTIYHHLSYKDYVIENISERIRLLYVALTRAKEKMIFILPQNKKEENNVLGEVVDQTIRKKYNSFASIMYSLEPVTRKYYTNISLEDINLTKEYNLLKNSNYKKEINNIDKKINVEELSLNINDNEEKTFSKKDIHIITKEEQNKLNYGTKIHELLEYIDFKNPDYNNLNTHEKEIITNFINKIDVSNALSIYHEYEFIYDEDFTTYHGIIDLMIEYENRIKIIDYKLKNINDKEYIKQLQGYKEYIEKLFNKEVKIYLNSIINNNLEEIK